MQGDPACVAFGLHNVQGPLRDIPLAGGSIVERSTILANYIADSGTLTANHLAHAITLSCLTSAFTMCKAYFATSKEMQLLGCLTSAFTMCKAHFDTFEQMTPHFVMLIGLTSPFPMCEAYFGIQARPDHYPVDWAVNDQILQAFRQHPRQCTYGI